MNNAIQGSKRKGVFNTLSKKTLRMTPSMMNVIPPDTTTSYFNLVNQDDQEGHNDLSSEQMEQIMFQMGKKLLIDEESINKLLAQNTNLVDNLNQLKKLVNNLTEDVSKLNDRLNKQDKKIIQLEREIEDQTFKFPASTESKCDRSPSYIS
ncbi:MAG: hypothetical protein WD512_21015 [Candidatus Paceibacterota bacterium]